MSKPIRTCDNCIHKEVCEFKVNPSDPESLKKATYETCEHYINEKLPTEYANLCFDYDLIYESNTIEENDNLGLHNKIYETKKFLDSNKWWGMDSMEFVNKIRILLKDEINE